MHLYVSADATPNGDGSEERPYATIDKARRALRSVIRNGLVPNGGVVVHVAEGDYYQTSAINFDSEDSGESPEAPIIYVAEGDVRLIGGLCVDLKEFEPTEKGDAVFNQNVVKYKAPSGTFELGSDILPIAGHSKKYISSDLYYSTPYFTVSLDEKPMELCRWPNADDGYATITAVENTVSEMVSTNSKYTLYDFEITCDEMDTALWTDDDIYIHGYWGNDYGDLKTTCEIVDATTIKADYPTYRQAQAGQRFYASNAPEMLDAPGEWYIDRENDVLYLYPTKKTGKVEIGTSASNLIYAKGLKNVVFDGISVVGGRTTAYRLNNSCKNITIKNCRITNVNGVGISGYGSNIIVNNCEIAYTGQSGITLQGGNFVNQTAGGNIVKNCSLHDMGRWQKCYSPAVSLEGYANTVENNEIYNLAHTAVMMTGFEHRLHYNEIYNVVNESSDMGAVYVHANPSRRGTVIEYNHFHDLVSDSTVSATDIAAIFLDDICAGYTIDHNIFENINGRAVKSNGGRENTITNNVFINNTYNARYGCVCIAKNEDGEFYVPHGDDATASQNSAYEKYYGYATGDTYIADGQYKEYPFTKFPRLANYLEDDPLWAKYNVFKDNYMYNCKYDYSLPTSVAGEYMSLEVSGCEFVSSTQITDEKYENILKNDYTVYGINYNRIGR